MFGFLKASLCCIFYWKVMKENYVQENKRDEFGHLQGSNYLKQEGHFCLKCWVKNSIFFFFLRTCIYIMAHSLQNYNKVDLISTLYMRKPKLFAQRDTRVAIKIWTQMCLAQSWTFFLLSIVLCLQGMFQASGPVLFNKAANSIEVCH